MYTKNDTNKLVKKLGSGVLTLAMLGGLSVAAFAAPPQGRGQNNGGRGEARQAAPMPAQQRPNFSRPAQQRPNFSRPAQQQPNFSRPAQVQGRPVTPRPVAPMPNVNRNQGQDHRGNFNDNNRGRGDFARNPGRDDHRTDFGHNNRVVVPRNFDNGRGFDRRGVRFIRPVFPRIFIPNVVITSGYNVADIAQQNGYRDGYSEGQYYWENDLPFDVTTDAEFQQAMNGYIPAYGSPQYYQANYQEGFERGFQDALNASE